jgi:hypothetical protein
MSEHLMSVEEFLVWADRQPEQWELFDSVPAAMSADRVIHGETKYRTARALDEAIAKRASHAALCSTAWW